MNIPQEEVSAALALQAFLRENYGVLVTPDAEGSFVCQCCAGSALFASQVIHGSNCVFHPSQPEEINSHE